MRKTLLGKTNYLPRKKICAKIGPTPRQSHSLLSFILFMARKKSETLKNIFGTHDDVHVSKKLIKKLIQYNMKYEEITKVILSHSERAFLDARLITLEEYYQELQQTKKSEVEQFLASIPEFEFSAHK